uniref:Uncharacterized protein n=1 Tax=Bionectria ochroleuca TaxID=29856 RepID=A0A0B7KHJ0_BIOOC
MLVNSSSTAFVPRIYQEIYSRKTHPRLKMSEAGDTKPLGGGRSNSGERYVSVLARDLGSCLDLEYLVCNLPRPKSANTKLCSGASDFPVSKYRILPGLMSPCLPYTFGSETFAGRNFKFSFRSLCIICRPSARPQNWSDIQTQCLGSPTNLSLAFQYLAKSPSAQSKSK